MTEALPVTFTAVVCTVGRTDVLAEGLESLLATSPAPEEILVVDGDAGGSAAAVTERFAGRPVPVRHLRSPRGLTRQRNVGLQAATGDVVAFFDDDATVAPDVFAHLGAAYAEPTVVGATGRVVEPDAHRVGRKASPVRRRLFGGGEEGGFTRFGFPHRLVDLDQRRDVSFMQGCFMTARRTDALAVRFDEALPGYALAEDEDFSCRLSRRGRIRYLPEAVVHHANAGFSSRDARAFGRTVVAHRVHLFRKNFPQTPLARAQFVMMLGVLVGHRVLNRDWRGAGGLLEGAWRVLVLGRDLPVEPAAAVPLVLVSSHAAADGGSERYLLRLGDGLGRPWVGSVVLLARGPLVAEVEARGWPVEVVPTGASPLALAAGAWRLRRALGRRPTELIAANGVKAALVAVLAAGPRRPVVWIKHDFSWDGRLARGIARRCRLVIGVSSAVLAGLPAERCRAVPTGYRPPALDAAAGRLALDTLTGGHHPTAVVAGRLHPVKGHAEAIAALAALDGRCPDLHLVIVGGEDPSVPGYQAEVESLVAGAGLTGRVVWAGHRPDLPDLLAAADGVLVTSGPDGRGMGREGFGLVALEAMAAGTPVVGYADGAIPEVVGSAGLLVAPGDRSALADALYRVLTDPRLAEELGERGRRRAAGCFSEDRWLEDMRSAFRQAVAG